MKWVKSPSNETHRDTHENTFTKTLPVDLFLDWVKEITALK